MSPTITAIHEEKNVVEKLKITWFHKSKRVQSPWEKGNGLYLPTSLWSATKRYRVVLRLGRLSVYEMDVKGRGKGQNNESKNLPFSPSVM